MLCVVTKAATVVMYVGSGFILSTKCVQGIVPIQIGEEFNIDLCLYWLSIECIFGLRCCGIIFAFVQFEVQSLLSLDRTYEPY